MTSYFNRRGLRTAERTWTALEGSINRLAHAARTAPLGPANPLYYLGPLEIFLLLFLGATGVILLLLYRPGVERSYESVQAISSGWLGSILRTSHRYASDALLLVAFLHALKMLLSDRFWESRWLAWTSGWLLVVLFWLTGTMGYFLVWDTAAQWLTEYAVDTFGGAFALSFLGPQAAGRSYSFFVIVLFLHAFIPLVLAIGILVHVLRLQRPRYWAPRWLMIAATAILVLLSVLWPAVSNLPADLRKLVFGGVIDWWYMGFLPLTARLGPPAFWSLSLALLTLVMALPWLLRGRHAGPSAVDDAKCTGCAACARECPYSAIEMAVRAGDTSQPLLAAVRGQLCTGCGVCVAACPEDAIGLVRLEMAALRVQVAAALSQARPTAASPLMVYTCDRHAALGSLPSLVPLSPSPQEAEAGGASSPQAQGAPLVASRIGVGVWPGTARPAVTCALPCMGALQPEAIGEAIAAGAGDVLLVACPMHDCSYREGSRWLDARIKRRAILQQPAVHLLIAAPGSRAQVLAAAQTERTASSQGSGQARGLAAAALVLALLLGASALANRRATPLMPRQGQIKIAINHRGQLLAQSSNLPPEARAKLPPGVDPALVLGGERFPVRMQMLVDGAPVVEREYRAAGLRREGSVYALEKWWLPPGVHQVAIDLMDDGASWRAVYRGEVQIAPGQSLVLIYDPATNAFARWE